MISLTLAAAAAALFATAPTLADKKTEKGVVLEFWKGHFDRNAGPFHEWDKEKEIPGVCARCHGAQRLPEYLATGRTGPAPHAKNGLACFALRDTGGAYHNGPTSPSCCTTRWRAWPTAARRAWT
jgi:hypothetical protein